MGKSRKSGGSHAGLVVALIVISLVVAFWQWILLGVVLWLFFRILWTVQVSKDADPYPKPKRQRPPKPGPVRSKTVATVSVVTARPMPARELPAPDYLPRWSMTRRVYASREHDEWQQQFDSMS